MPVKQIASILSLIILGILLVGAHIDNERDRPLAFVQKFKPSVNIKNMGEPADVQKRGKPLYNGDTLQTDDNGFALVQFMDKSLAKVKPNSRLIVRGKVEGKQNTSTRIGLELGEIFLNVSDQGANNFDVSTEGSVASVKGTKFGAAASQYYWVEEGEVELRVNESGKSVTLTDQTYGRVKDDGGIEKGELTGEEIEEKIQEYAHMDEKMEPEIYKLRFVDEQGHQRVIEIKVFENNN